MKMQSQIIITFVLLVLQLSLVYSAPMSEGREKRSLPCSHPLRLVVPSLFTHCVSLNCTYSNWSEWIGVPGSKTSVPKSQCPSGKAFTEVRTRAALGEGCTEPLNDTQSVCFPSQEELLIITLGLGGSGHNYNPINKNPIIKNPTTILSSITSSVNTNTTSNTKHVNTKRQLFIIKTQPCSINRTVCESFASLGKRSTNNVEDTDHQIKPNLHQSDLSSEEIGDLPLGKIDTTKTPLPFEWSEHAPRLRRHLRQRRQARCSDNDVQNVLFVLDSSGSIGEDQFKNMTDSLAQLTPLFCRQVQFALITFSSAIRLEFCFNCYENTYTGRQDVQTALRSATFQNGMTRTGATAKCICEELLSRQCGIEEYPNCLDVVFITDGKSNDIEHKICDEIACLHSRLGVNTYAIGINSTKGYGSSYDSEELNCIREQDSLASSFEYESFDDFYASINNVINMLTTSLKSGKINTCVQTTGDISPTGAAPFNK